MPHSFSDPIELESVDDALFEERERARITLDAIGDAVMSTDVAGSVTYLNAAAERITGWTSEEAVLRPFWDVFRVIDATSRQRALNPLALAMRENRAVSLAPNCLFIRRDGVETSIEDSATPIHGRRGQIIGAVVVSRDVTKSRAQSVKMAYLALHDSLTDLPNRMSLCERLTDALALASRHQEKLAVLFLDMDRFKHVNDSLGHSIGDRLLQSVAKRLRDCVRSTDTVSRQGGDEFVVLLSEVRHPRDAAGCAGKILQSLREPHRIDEHELYLTTSIGIAIYPDDASTVETLIKSADIAMYLAKETGRDSCQFFQPEMNVRAIERQSMEQDLRTALARQEFVLHYQPTLNLETGAVVGAEALIRWFHPARGLVDPGRFIPVAEDTGLIVPIGRWVLRESCRQARAWLDQGLPPLRLSINVSPVELRAEGFVSTVQEILAETGLEPAHLELELTETYLVQDTKSTALVLQSLKDLGLKLALDDFGTGYSSLTYLKRFPIDTLKIDRSFVRDLAMDADDASIVSAVIGMGLSLQMRVVAEGIENREQLAFLREHNCREGQGFYFSKAIPAALFAQQLTGFRQEI